MIKDLMAITGYIHGNQSSKYILPLTINLADKQTVCDVFRHNNYYIKTKSFGNKTDLPTI